MSLHSLEEEARALAQEAGVQEDEWEKLMALMEPLKKYHEPTYQHCLRVGIAACELAREEGWHDLSLPLLGGIAHDIGKCHTPLELLNCERTLTPQEFEIIQKHPRDGYEMLEKDFPLPALVAGLHHHFQPHAYGLSLDDIPETLDLHAREHLENTARLIRLVDFHDAHTTRTDKHEQIQHDPSWIEGEEEHMRHHIPNYRFRVEHLRGKDLPI